MLDSRFLMLDAGFWILDARCTSYERCFFRREKAQNAQKTTKNEKKVLFLAISAKFALFLI
jgi:hypothetical protein